MSITDKKKSQSYFLFDQDCPSIDLFFNSLFEDMPTYDNHNDMARKSP